SLSHFGPQRLTTTRFTMSTISKAVATTLLAAAVQAGAPVQAASTDASAVASSISQTGSYVTTHDGVQIYFKDWGPKDGPVVTFSHGWPLSSDSWESQMIFLASQGYRVVAHDRRGHGRSSQPWDGNDMDHYADDLAA